MTIFLITGLAGVSFYLYWRMKSANEENVALRNQIASLKRQLVSRRS
jgi:hypothetical protein